MKDCKPASTPLSKGQILVTNMNSLYIDSQYYCRLVGKLIFFTVTLLDIAYTVNRLSNYMANPQQAYLDVAKHVLKYLQGTFNVGILYHTRAPTTITGYTKANWGSCLETQRSMGAYLFTLARGPITWQSKCQLTISCSSTESKYCTLSDKA